MRGNILSIFYFFILFIISVALGFIAGTKFFPVTQTSNATPKEADNVPALQTLNNIPDFYYELNNAIYAANSDDSNPVKILEGEHLYQVAPGGKYYSTRKLSGEIWRTYAGEIMPFPKNYLMAYWYPDSTRVLFTNKFGENNIPVQNEELIFWDTTSNTQIESFQFDNSYYIEKLLPNGKILVRKMQGNSTIADYYLYTIANKTFDKFLSVDIDSHIIAISPNGNLFAYGEANNLKTFSFEDQKIEQYTNFLNETNGAKIWNVYWSPKNTFIGFTMLGITSDLRFGFANIQTKQVMYIDKHQIEKLYENKATISSTEVSFKGWSNDESKFIFSVSEESKIDYWMYDMNTQHFSPFPITTFDKILFPHVY